MKTFALNKRANYDYEISDKIEGGIVLSGQEVKSVKSGRISLKGSYITIRNNEIFLINSNIPPYQSKNVSENYDQTRSRKILASKKQIKYLIGKISQKGLTLVPIRVYSKHGLVKIEFGIGKGRKKIDKREEIKKREARIKIKRGMFRFDRNHS